MPIMMKPVKGKW